MKLFDDFASRIETKLKVTDAPGMNIRFTMNRDAAVAFAQQLRLTGQLITAHERLRAALVNIIEKYSGPDNSDLCRAIGRARGLVELHRASGQEQKTDRHASPS